MEVIVIGVVGVEVVEDGIVVSVMVDVIVSWGVVKVIIDDELYCCMCE